MISLQEIFTQVYDQARYFSRVDYQQSLIPSLSNEEQPWLTSLLKMSAFPLLS
ncbi:MAG: DUF4058 family protein [Leptolyngbyaceae cyanobacterium MAG.088]|nr:DUF4058 family protein [Leptolyngbyaceae cyanobacterium MAG.088]